MLTKKLRSCQALRLRSSRVYPALWLSGVEPCRQPGRDVFPPVADVPADPKTGRTVEQRRGGPSSPGPAV
jgi:hypothetical protein